MKNDTDNGYLAERLNKLINDVRRPDGRPYSLRQIADGVNTRAGEKVVSANHLCLLRNGYRRNPGFRAMQAIADWFGVSVSYFEDDGEPARRELSALGRHNAGTLASQVPVPRQRLEGSPAERPRIVDGGRRG